MNDRTTVSGFPVDRVKVSVPKTVNVPPQAVVAQGARRTKMSMRRREFEREMEDGRVLEPFTAVHGRFRKRFAHIGRPGPDALLANNLETKLECV